MNLTQEDIGCAPLHWSRSTDIGKLGWISEKWAGLKCLTKR